MPDVRTTAGGVTMASAPAPKKNSGPKHVQEVTVRRSANGGHIIRHHFANSGPEYHEPEEHTFGPGEDGKVMGHLKKHCGLKSGKKPAPVPEG